MPPTMLLNSLETVRRRVKLLGVLYGVGVVIAAAVGLLLATILIDYVMNLYPTPRVLIILAALAGVGYSLWRWVYKPIRSKLTINDVAGRLEQAFPQFNDRLRSTVDFIGVEIPGSEMMKQRVVGEATELAGRLDLGRAVVAKPAWYSLGAGGGAIVVAVLLAMLAPHYASIAMSRLMSPFSGQAWPKRVQIALSGELPSRVPVGQRVDVRMHLTRGDSASRQASIHYQYDDGPVQHELMIRGPDGTYGASLDARVETGKPDAKLKIWMQAGDDRMQLTPITVVPRLSLRSVEAQITPPPYVLNQPPMVVNLAAVPALAADGSKISLRIKFSKPLDPAWPIQLKPASDEIVLPDVKWTNDPQAGIVGSWVARKSVRFRIAAKDLDGFTNNALEEYEVIVRPDQMPSVQIENPRRNEERTAASVVPLAGLADDDYAIESLKLIVERAADQKRWETELVKSSSGVNDATVVRAEGATDRLRLRVNYSWDLAKLADANLKPGDILEYYLVVQDNFNFDGQTHPEVPSGRLRISIITEDDLNNRIIEELRQIKTQIQAIKAAVERTRQETLGLANDTKEREQLDAADRAALDRLTNQQATSTSQTKSIATRVNSLRERLNENRVKSDELANIARDVQSDLDRAAENPMREATNKLSAANRQKPDASKPDDPQQPELNREQRNEALADVGKNQEKAGEDLQQALDRMANIGSLQEAISRMRAMLEAQQNASRETREIGKQNLGKTPEQMKPEDRNRLNQNADEQAKLAEQTNRAIQDMQRQAEQMQRSAPTASEAMNQAAKTGQQQQTPQNQQKAAQQARQNQQAQAQAAQQQAELGLELMLNNLREAERHRLAELQKKLEELEAQINNLIRRQAGHNLDNLAVQGPERLAKIDAQTLTDLNDMAERDRANPPPAPQVTQLSPPQEQTERNTRDIARAAEQMPNGAEPASRLTRAAGRMERAVVNIREQKLPDAYDPAQVEALAELNAAKNTVAQQRNNVEQQIAQQQRDSIRQQFVKIRGEQQKLNDDTTRIEKARNPDNSVNRAEAVRLGQLPGEQGKLSDAVKKLSEDLAALGSTVYTWANQDIVKSMTDVKDDLGQQKTGIPTQAEEARIVAQLDAMIRNLATKPNDSKFAQNNPGGGGGAGQGGAQLPPEAELRLLQDLQRAVNASTKVIDAQPQKDKPKLVALGNRQGELRNVLDEMLQKASRGKIKLSPEPDNRNLLPEEAKPEEIDNNELDQELLQGSPDAAETQKQTNLIGDRMARSRQRLALNNDPGNTTQLIQERIIIDMNQLIQQAQQQQAQTRNAPPRQGQGQQQPRPGQNPGQPQNAKGQQQQPQNASTPAGESTTPGAAGVNTDLSKEIAESRQDWGAVAPRLRDAVLEGAGENIPGDYRKLIEEYYRAVSTKGAGQ